MIFNLSKCNANILGFQEKRGTEDKQALQVDRAPREKQVHALTPARASRVRQVNKGSLDQSEAGAFLGSRDLWDPKV